VADTGTVKLVCFSIKHYGFTLVRSWCEPFMAHFNLIGSVDPSTGTGSGKGIVRDRLRWLGVRGRSSGGSAIGHH
jgi:hypothetical protein